MLCAPSDLVLVAVWQQSQEAGTLDASGQLALEIRAGAGEAGRRNFAVFANEVTQGVDIFIVNLLNTGNGEAAKAFAAKQQGLLVAFGFAVFGEPAFTTWWGHFSPLKI
jgi:hypothetical protein